MSALAALRPRPVFCVNEHEHRDRALADAVAAGRFTHVGEPVALGLSPDWLGAALPADAEWRIEWVKFYYGLDLADAFRATGAPRYLEAFERLAGSFLAQVPPDRDAGDVTARRVLNWLYAWQRLPEVSDELALALSEGIAAQVAHVRATLTPERNHRTLELYALLIAGLALPSLGDGLVEFAVRELHANLLRDFRPDGVHREASTHYHMIALRSFVGALENCRRYGVALPAGFCERVWAACDFARACRRPDGTIPALSDSDTGCYDQLLRLAARLLGRDELRASAAGAASFPDGGYFFQRAAGRYLVLDCGPLGDGGHGHYDLLSVEAWDGPRPLVLDPGRFTYAEGSPNWRRWFRGTAAHNTVCVDGFDQTPYSRGRSSAPSASGRLLGRASAPGLDVIAAEARSPVYDAVHVRRVALVGGAYWVIEDRLSAPSSHRYDLRFHLAPGPAEVRPGDAAPAGSAAGAVSGPAVAQRGDAAPAGSGAGALAGPAEARRSCAVLGRDAVLAIAGAGAVSLEEGWISPRYGIRHAAPVVSAVAEGRAARFVTVLAAREPGRPAPRVMLGADGAIHVDLLEGALDRVELGRRSRWTRRAADGTTLNEATAE